MTFCKDELWDYDCYVCDKDKTSFLQKLIDKIELRNARSHFRKSEDLALKQHMQKIEEAEQADRFKSADIIRYKTDMPASVYQWEWSDNLDEHGQQIMKNMSKAEVVSDAYVDEMDQLYHRFMWSSEYNEYDYDIF